MSLHAEFPTLDGLSYEDRIPVSWALSPSLPSESEQYRFDRDNQELLEALLIIGEPIPEIDDEQDSGAHDYMRRMDVKLNLLTSLVRELLVATVTLPDIQSVQIGVQGLRFYAPDAEGVKVGQLLVVRLFLDPQFPRPLTLHGHVSAAQNGIVSLAYCPFSEVIQDLFDKHVFRHHRRAIAMQRQRGSA